MVKYAIDTILLCAVLPIICCGRTNAVYEQEHEQQRASLDELMKGLQKGEYEELKLDKQLICIICMEEYKPKDFVTFLPCDPRHNFHCDCIKIWLIGCYKCPICNRPITVETATNSLKFEEIAGFLRLKDNIVQSQLPTNTSY